MNKHILIALCAILSTDSTAFRASNSLPKNDSLKKIMTFINEQSKQESPVFDLTAKPRFEHINSALDNFLQKAISDKAMSGSTPPADQDLEAQARQLKDALQQLLRDNSSWFLSDAELNAPPAPLVKIQQPATTAEPATSHSHDSTSNNFDDSDTSPSDSDAQSYAQAEDLDASSSSSSEEEPTADEYGDTDLSVEMP